ncbi:MAG: putative metal-binding motif-containing protein [Myxococcales bacterium]|nr:putative metal-binding motif-containing protein [Myxococcales bacterium]
MDGVPASLDCDDQDPNNFPGNTEICDGQDNDCDMDADGGAVDAQTYYTDADMDGWGVGEGIVTCNPPPSTATMDGDCNDADPYAHPDQNDVCPLGQTCKAIFDSGAGIDDGLYLIDPDGLDAGEEPLEVWCDMVDEGATAALIINSVNEGADIADFGAGYVSTELLAVDPVMTSSQMATAVQAWLDLNDYPYTELRLSGYNAGNGFFDSEWIAATDLRIAFGEDGYLLWNSPNGYYWCGGDHTYTDNGVGQVNQPMGAPNDCKGHASLGSGFDFSNSNGTNAGLTACGSDVNSSKIIRSAYGSGWLAYPNAGVSYVFWVR